MLRASRVTGTVPLYDIGTSKALSGEMEMSMDTRSHQLSICGERSMAGFDGDMWFSDGRESISLDSVLPSITLSLPTT